MGKVYYNDVPIGSSMNLYKQIEGELEGTFKSNSKTGKYVMALTRGNYKIEVELESGEIVSDSVRLDDIIEYVELHKDFRIYSDSNLITHKASSLQDILEAELKKEGKTVDTLFTDNINSEINLTSMDEGRTFSLNNILYGFNKSTLRPESSVELDRLVVILKEQDKIKIEISSHTDASRDVEAAKRSFKRKGLVYTTEAHDKRSKAYNQQLSQRRAQSVVDYLIKKGVSRDRLVAKGYGEEKPIATNDTEEGRQLNRRTEFKVLGNK